MRSTEATEPSSVRTLGQVLRYGVVGVTLNGLLYLLYLVLTALGLDPKVAVTIAFVVGVPLSFASHRRVTFRAESPARAATVAFAALYLAGYFLNLVGLYVLVDLAHWPHAPVQAGLALLVAALLFVAQKVLIFRA